jgi:DNA-binding transcriptional LysR family regulator
MAASIAQLQALVALADARTFSGAARRLRITQPAVTQHVANLAREYGTPLVDIVGRRVIFTGAGAYLTERARAIVEAVAALKVEMQEFEAAKTGTLRIGATLTIATYVLPGLIARFMRERPFIQIDARVGNTAAIAQMLRSHDLSLALIEGIVADEAIATLPFSEDELVLVDSAQNGHVNDRERVRAEDLAGVPFVSREPGSGTRDLGYEALARLGVHPRIVLELPSSEGILRAVEAGLGVAILSRIAAEEAERRGSVRVMRIEDLQFKRSFFLAGTHGRTLSPAQHAFAEMVLGPRKIAQYLEMIARR